MILSKTLPEIGTARPARGTHSQGAEGGYEGVRSTLPPPYQRMLVVGSATRSGYYLMLFDAI